MKAAFLIVCLLFCGCVTRKAAPSVSGIKASIGQAHAASEETSRQIAQIKAGAGKIDYKASRALEYF